MNSQDEDLADGGTPASPPRLPTSWSLGRALPIAPIWRGLLAMALTAVVLWIALSFDTASFVGLIFKQLVGVPRLIISTALTAAALVAIVRFCTGRARVAAGITVTILSKTGLGVGIVGFGTIPMIWVPPGFELVTVVVAVCSAICLGLFLGPRALRVLGIVGVVALLAGGLLVLQR